MECNICFHFLLMSGAEIEQNMIYNKGMFYVANCADVLGNKRMRLPQ